MQVNESIWLLMGVAATVGVLAYLRIAGQEWARLETRTRALAEIRAEQARVPVVAAESAPPAETPLEIPDTATASIAPDTLHAADSSTSASPQGPNGSPSH